MMRICRMVAIVWAGLLPFLFTTPEAKAQPFEARGMLVAVHRPVISSEITAKVKTLPLRVGEHFEKDALLVRFEDDLIRAQQDKTEAELEAARLQLENNRELERLQSIGTLEVALADVEVKKRLAEKEITDITLERCSIRAPFNGRVVDIFVDEHEYVGAKEKLMEIVSTDQVEIEVLAPAQWLTWLTPGLEFTVELDAIDFKTGAKVITVGATVDPVSEMVQIRGRLDRTAKQLLPGMSANVFFVK